MKSKWPAIGLASILVAGVALLAGGVAAGLAPESPAVHVTARVTTEGGDPVRAVTLAERICKLSGDRVAKYLDTLGAAYAATGRFGDAVGTAQKAIQLADSTAQTQLVSRVELRLELYRANHAYYEPGNATGSRTP